MVFANGATQLRRKGLNGFVPTIGGGAAGCFARSFADNSIQNVFNYGADYFSK